MDSLHGNKTTVREKLARASRVNSTQDNSETLGRLRRSGRNRQCPCDDTPTEKDEAATSAESSTLMDYSQTETCHQKRDISKNLSPIEFIEGSNTWKLEVFNITFNTKDNAGNFRAVFINQDGMRVTRTSDSLMKLILSLLIGNNDTNAHSNVDVASNHKIKKDASTNTLINGIVKQHFVKPIPATTNRKRQKKKMSPFLLNTNDQVVIKRKIIDPFDHSFDYLDNCKEDTNDSESATKPVETITQDFDLSTDQMDTSGESQDADDALSMGSVGTLTQSVINLNESGLLDVVNRFTSGESITGLDEPIHNRDKKRASYVPGPNKRFCEGMTNVLRNSSQISIHGPKDQTQKVVEIPRNINLNSLDSHQTGASLKPKMTNPVVPQISIPSMQFLQQILSSMSTVQSEEWFNLLSPERLKMVSKNDAEQLKRLQMYIDYKFCTESDDYGYFPIHNAVLREDMHLLKRQCFVLRGNGILLDIGDNNDNKSALHLCIANSGDLELVRVLLKMGASPLHVDATGQSAVHCAAENPSPEYMHLLLQHLRDHPSSVDSDDTAPPLVDYSRDQRDAALCRAVLMLDNNGYTPLMLAARQGNADHVTLLLEDIVDSARIANARSPNTGNTALYLAVEEACREARDRGDISKVPDKYARTIESLIRYGADHEIQNDYNCNVTMLANECLFGALSALVCECLEKNKMRSERVTLSLENSAGAIEKTMGVNQPFMIVKNGDQLQYLDKNGRKLTDARGLRFVRKTVTAARTSVRERDESAKDLPVKSTNVTPIYNTIEDSSVLRTMLTQPAPKAAENGDIRVGMEYPDKKGKEVTIHPSLELVNQDAGILAPVKERGKVSSDPPVKDTYTKKNTNPAPILTGNKSVLSIMDKTKVNVFNVKIVPVSERNVARKSIPIKNPLRKGAVILNKNFS